MAATSSVRLDMGTTRHTADTDVVALRRLFDGLIDAWNRADAAAFGAAFTEDADYVTFVGTHCRGRAKIADAHDALWHKVPQGQPPRRPHHRHPVPDPGHRRDHRRGQGPQEPAIRQGFCRDAGMSCHMSKSRLPAQTARLRSASPTRCVRGTRPISGRQTVPSGENPPRKPRRCA